MQVYRDINSIPQSKNAVITIGTFDGVHKGHQAIVKQINFLANEINGESIIITFYPHPRTVIQPGQPVFTLNTLDEKLDLLSSLKVNNTVVVPFSREFSELDAQEYVNDFLIGKFNPKIIVFGYDHRFGKNRNGNIQLLREIAAQHKIRVVEISKQTIQDITISSSKIRQALLSGDIQSATDLLGYNYSISGLIIKGDQIGRLLGYPTANIHVNDESKLIPGDGVYAVKVNLKNENYNGMMSIGMRPTFNGTSRRLEVNIFDFNRDIYGETLTVQFIDFMRKEERFNSVDDLIRAMKNDKIKTQHLLNITSS
jgi:riboflavin kinase/FMN adenylyltransferase